MREWSDVPLYHIDVEHGDVRGVRYQLLTLVPNYPSTPCFWVQVALRSHKLHLLLTEDNNVGLHV